MLNGMSPLLKRLARIAGIVAVFAMLSIWLRHSLGLDLAPESVRALGERMGPAGPILFVGLIAGRFFIGLPSQIVLIAAGICFGTLVGSVVGGLGLMLSGVVAFFAARYAGREAVERRLGPRLGRLLEIGGRRAGAVALALGTGYPVAPLSPIQAAAGLTPMSLGLFMPAAFVGGSARAATFAYFGDALGEWSPIQLLLASLAFLAIVLTPLCFPQGRAWVRKLLRPVDALPPVPAAARNGPVPLAEPTPAPRASEPSPTPDRD